MSTLEPVTVIAILVGLGVGSHVLANRLRVPSVTIQVLAGVIVGPEVLGVVQPAAIRPQLSAVVGVAVAVVVFDGAYDIDFDRLRESTVPVRLVTVGALVALAGTTALVRVALAVPWAVALLVAALLVATGPTVVTPILETVRVPERLRHALEAEGVTNDVTAAVLAVGAFELVTLAGATPGQILRSFGLRLAVGLAVGAAVAVVLWILFTQVSHAPSSAPQDAGLLVLAGALVAYGAGEAIAAESGIAAAAVGGALLGEADLRYHESLSAFRSASARFLLGVVFVLLATLIRFSDIVQLGLGGVAVVLGVAFLVRPVAVVASTLGSEFTWAERAFATLVAPRGIVPTAVATLFALELQPTHPRAATVLSGTVFLVVLATILLEGGWAGVVADRLDLTPAGVVVVGGGLVGLALAGRYEEAGDHVTLLERSTADVEAARERGYTAHLGDGSDPAALRAAGAETARLLVAATDDDDANYRVAELAAREFDVPEVLARVNDPARTGDFDHLDVRTFPGATTLLWAVDALLDWRATPDWLGALVADGEVAEFDVGADADGRTVGSLQAALPERCFLVALATDSGVGLPDSETVVEAGDRVTLLGARDAVEAAVERWQTAT